MLNQNYAQRRASAENLPKAQRLRLAHPKDRAAAREDRAAFNDTRHPYRAPTLALAAVETGNRRLIGSVKRILKAREARDGKAG